jgi:hypothetical protein
MASFAKILPGVAVVTGAGGTGKLRDKVFKTHGFIY